MKTQFNYHAKVQTLSLAMLTVFIAFSLNPSFADTVQNNSEVFATENLDVHVTSDEQHSSIGDKDINYVSFNGNGDAVYIRLFEKKIGNLLTFTQFPIKWLESRKKSKCCSTDTFSVKDNSKNLNSNIEFDLNFGFLNREKTSFPEQFIALSGHINRFEILFVLILNS
ncbi:MAG: hypothetical protein PHT69_05420 [Bacteroidales bacterium]|nr:hypothetical protein [Bacteroidales bacterium]